MFTAEHKEEWAQLTDVDSKYHSPPTGEWLLEHVLNVKRNQSENEPVENHSDEGVPDFLRDVLNDCHNVNHPQVKSNDICLCLLLIWDCITFTKFFHFIQVYP